MDQSSAQSSSYCMLQMQLIKCHQLVPHAFADDTQICGFLSTMWYRCDRISACNDEVLSWMRAKWLQANPSKTKVLWCSSCHCQHQIPITSLRIGTTDILSVFSVGDLGVYIDSYVTMRTHVIAAVRLCFSALLQLCSMRRCLWKHASLTLIRALFVSKVGCCCSLLAGVSGHLLNRFQSVLKAAARPVYSARCSVHFIPLLRQLHWLRVPEQIWFCLCILTYCFLNGTSPSYLVESIRRPADVDVEGRCYLRLLATTTLIVTPTRWSTLGDRAFLVAAPLAWNSLPFAVRTTTSLITFQRELEAFLCHLNFVDLRWFSSLYWLHYPCDL